MCLRRTTSSPPTSWNDANHGIPTTKRITRGNSRVLDYTHSPSFVLVVGADSNVQPVPIFSNLHGRLLALKRNQ